MKTGARVAVEDKLCSGTRCAMCINILASDMVEKCLVGEVVDNSRLLGNVSLAELPSLIVLIIIIMPLLYVLDDDLIGVIPLILGQVYSKLLSIVTSPFALCNKLLSCLAPVAFVVLG